MHDALVDMLGKPLPTRTYYASPTRCSDNSWVGPGVKAWQHRNSRSKGDSPWI